MQQPDWPDPEAVDAVTAQIAKQPPLVFAGECDQLKARMAEVAAGEAFVLQGGDCAETFEGATPDAVRGKLETLLQMAVVLTYAASVPIVKIGRVAGQFAKPRSSPTESHDGAELPSYRGDAVNALEFTPEARNPDPARMLDAYHRSAATLNLCRAFTSGGYADLHQVHAWNRDFVAESPAGRRYDQIAGDIDRALSFMSACGIDPEELHGVEFYSSHEALLLEYERALTRIDSRTGTPYNVSAHLPWIGERTRDPDGAHVELLSKIRNPVAVKLGPTATADDALALIERLNPDHEPGRLSLPAGDPRGRGDLRDDEVWFAVLMRVQNETGEPLQPSEDIEIEDTQDEVFEPIELDETNLYAYRSDFAIPPREVYPVLDSPAHDTPSQGSLLLFKLTLTALNNRPLELKIEGRKVPQQTGIVDLDV